MNRFAAISLLMLFLFQLLYTNLNMLLMFQLKANRWERLENPPQVLLVLNQELKNGNAKLIDKGKELVYNNSFYDIEKILEKSQSGIKLLVKHDESETLLSHLQKKQAKKFYKSFQQIECTEPTTIGCDLALTAYLDKAFDFRPLAIYFGSLSADAPPPKVFS